MAVKSGSKANATRSNSGKISRRTRNRRRNNNNRNRPKQIAYNSGLTQNTRVKRKEILATGTFTTDANLQIKHHIFDAANGPAWFKKMCDMYEKYRIHSIDLEVVFGGSKMSKGTYILSYNTNYAQRNDVTQTQSAIMAQKGAKQVCAADQVASIHINGSGLTGYSTTLPTTGNESYCFDAILAGVPVEDLPYTINVYYDATFYNPQIAD